MRNFTRPLGGILTALVIVANFFLLPATAVKAQAVYDNAKLRFGTGLEASVNATGNLQQPFYYNGVLNVWRKLTYFSYPLDNAFAIGGDKTNEWNANGSIVQNPVMTDQVLDVSGFVVTSGTKGYGTVISTGKISLGGQLMEVRNTYFLPQNNAYIKVTSRVRNISAGPMENVRIWIGTRDDYVGEIDWPRKQKGNLINNAFAQNTQNSQKAAALKISTGDEGVLFYTNSTKGNIIVHPNYGDFYSRIVTTNPASTTVDITSDGSYGFYVRLNDLNVNSSDEFTWYYAAGELAELEDIIAKVASVSGAVQNITYTTADLKATTTINSTGYWMVVPQNSAVPTAAQIKAGANYNGVTVARSGSAPMTANVERIFNMTGLTAGTAYDVHFVSQDVNQVFSALLRVPFSTQAYTAPTVSTTALSNLSTTGVTTGGNVTADGGTPVTARGVVWSTANNPTIANASTSNGSGTGTFSSIISGLNPNTTYYVRAYATNTAGTAYGNQYSFTTSPEAPTSITASANNICIGISTTLTANGAQGTVNWYTASCGGTFVGSGNMLTVSPAANTTYYARNYNGTFSNSCASIAVTVNNNPPVAMGKNVTVNLQANLTASVSASAINSGSSDDCGTVTLGITSGRTTFGCSDIGQTFPVVLTVTDQQGHTASTTVQVTVADPQSYCNTAPVAVAKAVTVSANANCKGIASAQDFDNGSSDANGDAMTFSVSPAGPYALGTTNVTFMVTDSRGAGTSVNTTITVVDQIAPVLSSVAPVSVTTDLNVCGAVVNYTTPTATDNCSGNAGSSGSKVLLIWDEMNPNTTNLKNTLTAAGLNVTLSATSETGYNGSNPSLTGFDAVIHLNGTTYGTGMPAAGQAALVDFVVNKGKTYITDEWSAYEVDDNLTMTAMRDIVVLQRSSGVDDVFNYTTVSGQAGHPLLTGLPASFTLPRSAGNVGSARTYSSNQPVVVMNCQFGAAVAVRNFANGGRAVGFQHAGNYGGYSTLSDVNVQKLYINAVKYGNTVGATVTQTTGLPAGSVFPVGTTTNTFVATDAAGNTASISFNVTVTDNQLPTISAPAAVITVADNGACSAVVTLGTPVTADNCGVQGVTNDAPAAFPVGATTVTWTVTDIHGNSTSATQLVTVSDNQNPTITAPANVVVSNDNGNCGATVVLGTPVTADNCAVATVTNDAPATFPVGTTTVTWTVTDIHSNVATATQAVTVNDTEVPMVATQHITVQLDATGNAAITTADINNGSSDNCGIAAYALDKTSFDCSNVGANTVTLTITDVHNNTASATAIVTVQDNVAPVAVAQNLTLQLDATGNGAVTAADVNNGSSDACGIKSLALSQAVFDCSHVGPNTVTLTVTDNNDNVSTVDAVITVKDEVAPVAIAKNATVQLDANGNGSITAADVNNGSSDACGVASVTVSPAAFTCANVGPNTVTLTVTDNNGNVSTTTATVTVEDNVAPVALAQNITVTLANGVATITAADLNNGSNDACGIASMTLDKTSFDCSNLGANEVTLTVTDHNGNVSAANASVTVIGMIPTPEIAVSRTNNTFTGANMQKTIFLGYGAQSLTLTCTNSTSAPYASTYKWTGNGVGRLNNANVASPVFSPTAAGTYTFTVECTNEFGCQRTAQVTIDVVDAVCGNKNDKVMICHNGTQICVAPSAVPAHLAHAGDYLGYCNTNTRTSGAAIAKTEAELTVFPNPFSSATNLEFTLPAAGKYQVQLIDMKGALVKVIGEGEGEINKHYAYEINGENMPAGMYIVRLISATEVKHLKIMLRR